MTVKGIDVSSYQSSTYSTAGLDFVFVKATEGTSYINPRMTAQAARARAAGLVVGFYHFLRPGSMKAQAAYFVEECASIEGDPLFADWEDDGVSCAQKDAFLAEVKRLRGATHRVGLYCGQYYWLNRDTTSNAGDALWIADYVTAGKPRIKAAWKFHQYTDSPVDTNLGRFDNRTALREWTDV
ncbi:glycoside hydrolase family 25 protein [Streptomyces sp. NPDC006923]|uniref:glycoside hydrolase family 25 protein n=1 Tax=Streptomyces sp. NPDC006923 TaxID=3155355 RepID=UPI0033F661FE